MFSNNIEQLITVSTHSRPKAAAFPIMALAMFIRVSTHSRPKAAAQLTQILMVLK